MLGQNSIPSRINWPSVLINSLPLQEVIRKLIAYYPGGNITGKSIYIRYPYEVLFHHYDELKDYRESLFHEGQPCFPSMTLEIRRVQLEQWKYSRKP